MYSDFASGRRRNTLLVLGLALLGRAITVGYAIAHFPSNWFFMRGQEMGLLGDALVRGLGLSSPFGPETGATAMIAPGYPVLVAAVFRLLGSYTRASSVLLMAVNLGLNLLTVGLVLHLARRFATERAAVLAAAIWAGSLPLLWMPTIFWETSFSCCLLLGSICVALDLCEEQATSRLWMGAGLLAGFAVLMNPALLPSLLPVGGFAAWRAGSARKAGLALLVCAVVFSPWPIRNARVFHAFIPTRTTVGLELWMGNHAGSTGFLEESLFPTFNPAELGAYEREGELLYTGRKGQEAGAFIRAHPLTFLRLTVLRIGRFWTGRGSRNGSVFLALHAMLTTVLGGLGAWGLLRSGSRRVPRSGRDLAWLILVVLAVFPLPYYVTHAEFRYRLIVDPLLTVLAARPLERFRSK